MSKVDEVRKLLGSSFLIGFAGVEASPEVSKFIKENYISGVTLFANNYESPAQVAELTNYLQSLGTEAPLFMAVDHEGGRVQRFKKPFTKFPEARFIGDLNSPKLVFEYALAQAKELKAVGINTVFAPVADINTNSKNPVIGNRAYGDNEEQVTKTVSAIVRGFVNAGIQPVVKHFPGHGDTSQDSHFHLPKVSTTLEVLQNREFKPFSKVFRSHCEMVMTAHIIVEKIEPKIPATLSSKILKGILRDQLRFTGLIVTDDMEMKAIADHFGEVDAPRMALEAGADLLLYHTMPFIEKVFEPLMSVLTSPKGSLALDQLKISANRIMEFKKKNFLPWKPVYIPEIESVVGSKEHKDLLAKIEKEIKITGATA